MGEDVEATIDSKPEEEPKQIEVTEENKPIEVPDDVHLLHSATIGGTKVDDELESPSLVESGTGL